MTKYTIELFNKAMADIADITFIVEQSKFNEVKKNGKVYAVEDHGEVVDTLYDLCANVWLTIVDHRKGFARLWKAQTNNYLVGLPTTRQEYSEQLSILGVIKKK